MRKSLSICMYLEIDSKQKMFTRGACVSKSRLELGSCRQPKL